MNSDPDAAHAAIPPAQPELLGFRVVEQLGGAHSNVYKVRRESDQELFSAKVFIGLSPGAVQTVQHNCEQAFLLSHPRLIPVTGTGRSGDYFYILSEFTSGDSLAVCLERWRRLPYPQTLDMITALTQALAYGHMHGMHHGSLNPRKIMVLERIEATDERLRIAPDRGPDQVALFDPLNVKISGVGLGLPLETRADAAPVTAETLAPAWWYAAPERLAVEGEEGAPPGAVSDMFSLGCIFYQLLCGERPYAAATPTALRLKHQADGAALEPLRAVATPAKAVALIGHMIDREPAVRPSSYDALLEALSQLHAEHHAQLAQANAKPRRGGTSKRLNPVREAGQLLSAPPLPEKPYRTHFERTRERSWGRVLGFALLSSLATAGGIVAGFHFMNPPVARPAAPATPMVTQPPLTESRLPAVVPEAAAPAKDPLREAQAQTIYEELKPLVEREAEADAAAAIAALQKFQQEHSGTDAALKARTYCEFLEKKVARQAQPAPPAEPAMDPLLPRWEERHKQARTLAVAGRYDEALRLVEPQQLPTDLQTTAILKAAASTHGEIYAEVSRAWSATERDVLELISRREFEPALLKLDLVIKTWGVGEFIDRAQSLRIKVNAAQELDASRRKADELEKIRSREAETWAQQLYVIHVAAGKFQYDQALKGLETFQNIDLKNAQVKAEVADAVEIVGMQKDLLRRINARLDKAKLSIEWKNQRLRIMEINEKGVKGRTPEADPDPRQPGQGVAYITVPWSSVSLKTVYNNLYAYLIDTYQSDEHLMLAVFAHQHGLVEYEDEAAVAAQFGEAAARKVARVREALKRLDARLKMAPAGGAAVSPTPILSGTPAAPPQGVPSAANDGLLTPQPPPADAGVLPKP